MGKPVNKNYAKKIEIPTPTEWELKTHSYTEELIEHKNKILKKEKYLDSRILKIFKNFK